MYVLQVTHASFRMAYPVWAQREFHIRDPRPQLRLPRHHLQNGNDLPLRRGHRHQGHRGVMAGHSQSTAVPLLAGRRTVL